ncbi:uncharacterized protein LOC112516395 isoform X2 [Cynara cardunculus var. scolymus]|uniref:uncharacterized protein LOC112516395 isoform X2 n=1 Tax=Cynara cardunculus var. scolymus TaxID=59895 RepID=UPI000D62993E|nr:uncharacterized protein LOC112516395 isoform X2 [Cynara cardunculus var. scolymus]
MEVSPNSETKPRVRRRLIQSTLFPHKSQDNVGSVDEDFEPGVDQEDVEEDYCETPVKNNKKRKPRAASQSRASRKIAVNGNEPGAKNTDEEDSPVTVKVDFFVKVSERRHQQRQQKEQPSIINSPEKNEQCCSPPDVITNSKSPRKPRRRASSTPKKRQTCLTPEKRQMNLTPSRNAINGALHEDYSEKMLASPPKPIPDLRLEAKMTAEENSRIFAGKQIHPFFVSWKNGKKNTESTGTENKWCHVERKESNNDVNPVHIFEKTQSETFFVDWRNWTFSESIFTRTGQDLEDSCLQLIYEGSVNCLQFDNFLGVPPLGMSLCQNKGSSSQYPIQLEEISTSFCSMLQEKSLVTSSASVVDKLEPQCNQPKDIEVHEIGKTGGSLANTEFVVNLDTQWQDTLHTERMASKYHDCSYQPENSLWTTKYQPERAVEICGNYESVKFLNEWLRLWHEKGSRTNKCSTDTDKWIMQDVDLNYCPSDSASQYTDEESTLKNVLLVTGPVGSGKSAAIYACAKEQGFQVIEVNTSDWRNGALVKQKFGEAVESHWLQCSMPNIENPDNKDQLKSSKAVQRSTNDVIELIPLSDEEDSVNVGGTVVKSIDKENKVSCSQNGTKTLILFEDVDATLYEDRGFIATIQQLAETAKRPMILTSNSDDPDLPTNLDRLEVSFRIPSSEELLSLASLVCAAEKAEIEPCLVERFIDHCQSDIRKTITFLQFWCQGQNQRKDSEVRNIYGPLLFDIDAGHQVLPQLIPCGYTSKLSEMIEKEIMKSTFLVAKDASSMETIDEEEENNNDSMIEIERKHSIEAKKDEMLRRHCSDQDGNDFAARCTTINELPSCSSSPVAFMRRTLQKKYDPIMNTDSEECLNDGLLNVIEDVNEEVLVDTKRLRRKYNSVLSSDSEEERFDEGLRVKNVEVNEDEKFFQMENEQPLSEAEKLEETCHPSEIPYYSKINDICKSGDVSCVPESSYVPETEIENGMMMCSTMCSSGRVDGGIEEGPTSADCLPRIVPVEFSNLCYYREEDKTDSGLDTVPVHGEEIGDSHIEPVDNLPREYQMMDECSRIDFNKKAESIHRQKPVASMDLVQETWRKLRNCENELRQYVSVEEKDTLEALGISYGMTNLISEADLLLADCQSLTCDYVKPSMVLTEESHSFRWHDDQLQMASTIAQHGFCLYAKRSVAAGSSAGMDLASEMLAASTSAISLGKLINNRNNTTVKSNGKKTLQNGVSLKSMLESPLCNTVHSIVPLRSQLSLKGYIFHEYLSSLAQISRSESSRLSEAVNKSTQRRKRVARNYLSNGALALSSEDISLLDRFSCYRTPSSQSKTES